MTAHSTRFFRAQHEIRAQEPAKCWLCDQPASADGRGLCAAHFERALDQADDQGRETGDAS